MENKFLLRIICGFSLLSGMIFPSKAQSPRLYSTGQDLINTRITNLMLDRENFLWVSTEMGLARFNGRSFTTYVANEDDPYSLHSSAINCLYEDPSSRHWVGTTDGLYYFCRTENKFTHYDLSEDGQTAISISRIVAHPMHPNTLILSTFGYGICFFDAERREVDRDKSMTLSSLLDKYNITDICVDEHQYLWALLREGLNVVTLDSVPQRVTLRMSDADAQRLAHTTLRTVMEDAKHHRLYMGSMKQGLWTCDLNTMTLSHVSCPPLDDLDIYSLCADEDGNLLIGTENSGLYLFRPDANTLQPLHFSNCPIELEHSKIHNILVDGQNNLWLALFQQGVLVVPAPNDRFHYYPVTSVEGAKNLASVSSLVTRPSLGCGVVGTDGGGVVEWSRDQRRLYNTENSILPTNAIISLAAGEHEDVYVGTFNYGLYLLRDHRISLPAGLKELERACVMSLCFDPETHILYIGTNGSGIYAYDTRADHLSPIVGSYNPWIVTLAIDRDHTLWAGTEERLLRFDLQHGAIEAMDTAVNHKLRINSIVPDSSCLWLGSQRGLWRYDRATHALTALHDANARYGETILAMSPGNDGQLWMSTNFGITAFDPTEKSFVHYADNELSLVGSFSERAVVSQRDGHLMFGGDNGVLYFNPMAVSRNDKPLKNVYFTKLWINNVANDYDPASDENVLDASLWHARRLTLPADIRAFAIEFGVQEYSNPSGIQYAYRLQGYDQTWHEIPDNEHVVGYSHLPWGTYLFQVRAFTHDGSPENASFKQLVVEVLRPWYVQWWAFVLYVALLGFIVCQLVHYYRQRAHQRRLLERTEHKQQIKEAKLQLFTSISHEIKTPLTLILAPLRKLMDKKVDNATASVYELMYRNAMRILMLVNQQMDIRKIDHGRLKLKMRELSLQQFLLDIMEYYRNAAMTHQIHFHLEMPAGEETLTVWGDPDQLDKVFFNLLSNAFKYTSTKGEVALTVSRVDGKALHLPHVKEAVCVRVFNSGSSLSDVDIEHIFERFYQGKNSSENVGAGIGLNLAYELTELHHGQLSVRNIEGAGVEFSVLLPLGKAHLAASELATEIAVSQTAQMLPNDLILSKKEIYTAESQEETHETDDETAEPEEHRQVTVMLVDDDTAFLDYVRGELKEYNVVTATGGNEAWGQLLVSAPDVVVTDLKMPDGDGYQLCSRIKNNIDTDNIPVIVLTSETTDTSAEKSMKCEADRFLGKPLNINLLRGAIEQSLKVRRNILGKMRRTDVGFEYNQVQMVSADTQLMQRVMETIRKNLSDSDFNVETLSKEVGISRVHLNRKLKELLGTSPSTLIRSVRLKQAAFLLIDNDVTVSEIAYSVGFSSPSYFTSNFTSYFGMTPKAFVANYLKNPNDEKLKKLLE